MFTVDKAAHDRRVTELIAANNAEVARRRTAEAQLRVARDFAAETASELFKAGDLGDRYKNANSLRNRIDAILGDAA